MGARCAAAVEGLDDDHAAAAAGAGMRGRLGLLDCGAVGGIALRLGHGEQLAGAGDVVGAGRRVAAQLRLDTAKGSGSSDADLLKLAEQEIKELRESAEKDRITYQGLVEQHERERDQAREEAQQAQAAHGQADPGCNRRARG
jgi:hypothetical protein